MTATANAESAEPGCRPFRWIRTPAAAIAFYGAIMLPTVYLSLLITGLNTREELLLFLGLFGLHIVALLGGHSYRTASPAVGDSISKMDG